METEQRRTHGLLREGAVDTPTLQTHAGVEPEILILKRDRQPITAMSGVVMIPSRKPMLGMHMLQRILSGEEKYEHGKYSIEVGSAVTRARIWQSEHTGSQKYSETVQKDSEGVPIGIRMGWTISFDPRKGKAIRQAEGVKGSEPVKRAAPDLSHLEIFKKRRR